MGFAKMLWGSFDAIAGLRPLSPCADVGAGVIRAYKRGTAIEIRARQPRSRS